MAYQTKSKYVESFSHWFNLRGRYNIKITSLMVFINGKNSVNNFPLEFFYNIVDYRPFFIIG